MIAKHMNAVKVKERQLLSIDPEQWIMEEKFKGIRVWWLKTFETVKLITRGGEDVAENFPHLLNPDWYPHADLVQLDCELYDPEQEDEVVSGWAMREVIDPTHVENCVLMVFDILHINGTDIDQASQIQRKEFLEKHKPVGPLQLVPFYPAFNHRAFYEHILSRGGEGIMLKNKSATYMGGVRQVGRWLKRKKRDPYDCVIVGFTAAKPGKFEGLIGAVIVGQWINNSIRPICNVSGMTDEVRKDMTDFPEKYLGKICSIWAMEQDKNSKALIEPSWKGLRIDKAIEDCIPEDVDISEKMVDL